MRAFFDSFLQRVSSTPSDPFLITTHSDLQDEVLSFSDVHSEMMTRAQALSDQIQPDHQVFIIDPDPKQQMLWWMAVRFVGGVPAILTPPTEKMDRARYAQQLRLFVETYSSAFFIVASEMLSADLQEGLQGRLLRTEAKSKARSTMISPMASPSGLFLFQQSSGTTGIRKGVLLNEEAVIRQLDSYGKAIGVNQKDCIVTWLPLYHDMGLVACFLQAIYQAIPLVICSPFTWLAHPAWLVERIEKYRGSLSWMPNFAFKLMTDRLSLDGFSSQALQSLRLMVSCAEPVIAEHMNGFFEKFKSIGMQPGVLASSYAMAENVFAVTQSKFGRSPVQITLNYSDLQLGRVVLDQAGKRLMSSGQSLPNVEIELRQGDKVLGDHAVGEICIRSDCLFSSYHGVGAEISPFDQKGFYRTGDLGFFHEGELFVMGREKDLIIRAGRNIQPGDIEDVVSEVPFVKKGRVVAFGRFNEQEGTEEIVVLAEFDPVRVYDVDHLKRDIAKYLGDRLDLVVERIEIVRSQWLVKSSSGKISRKACKEKYEAALVQRQRGELNQYTYELSISEELKDSFAYFGEYSKIRTPVEVTNPGNIQIGNFVSLGRNGKLLILNDFSIHEKYARQHYPEVNADYPKEIFGRRHPKIKFGDGTSIGDNYLIAATRHVEFGRHVLASGRLFVSDSNHRTDHPDLPISLQANTLGTPLTVGDHTWLGIGVSLLEGAKIGKHCVISTGTVVNFEVPDYAVVAGNPARIVRFLKQGGQETTPRSRSESPQSKALENALLNFFQRDLGLDVSAKESLFRSGLVDSLRSLRVLSFIEDKIHGSVNEVEFFSRHPDTVEEIVQVVLESAHQNGAS